MGTTASHASSPRSFPTASVLELSEGATPGEDPLLNAFAELPYELFSYILCFMPPSVLGALCCTSRGWRGRILSCPDLWKFQFLRFFGSPPRNKKTAEGCWGVEKLDWHTFMTAEVMQWKAKRTLTSQLLWGAIKGYDNIVRLALERRSSRDSAITEMTDQSGMTALMIAASRGYLDVVTTLVACGARLNVQDREEGLTPLMFAVRGGQHDVVEHLLSHNAQTHIVGKNGWSALHRGMMLSRPCTSYQFSSCLFGGLRFGEPPASLSGISETTHLNGKDTTSFGC